VQLFLTALLRCSIAMSVISLVYITAMPLLSKRYSAKWLYYTWLVIVIGWVFPFRPHLDTHLFPFQIPNIQVIEAQYIDVSEPLTIITNGTGGASAIPQWWVIISIWIIGMVGMIAYNVWRHGRFLKMVNRWSEDITNQWTLDVLDKLRTEMKIGMHVGLKICPGITSPMMIGFFSPVILLPSIKIASDELIFILRHELVHLKRNDLWYKALVLLATAVHWFNPVVHIMAKAIAVQCEISCDELLLQETSIERRKQYGETIIGVVRNGAKLQTALSTDFYRVGKGIKTRIFYIMDTTKKKAGITILSVALMAIIGSGTTFASSPAKIENACTPMQAKRELISPNLSKQVINVDVKTLEGRKFVCLGPYALEGDDIIKCDITTEGNNGNLTIKFVEDNKKRDIKGPLQGLAIIDCRIQNPDHRVKVSPSPAGSYWLVIGNDGGVVLNNIKGTIEITTE